MSTGWPGIRAHANGQYEARIWWRGHYHVCGRWDTLELAKQAQREIRAELNARRKEPEKPPARAASGVKGVYRHAFSGKWYVRIPWKGQQYYCGTFGTVAEAEEVAIAKRAQFLTQPPDPASSSPTISQHGDWKLSDAEFDRRCTAEWAKALEKKTAVPTLVPKTPKRYRVRSSTGFRGVYLTKEGHFKAQTSWGGKTHCVGTYATPELAIAAVEAEYVRLKAEPPPPTMRPRDHRVKEYGTRLRADVPISIETSIDLYRRAWRRIRRIEPIPPVVETWDELAMKEAV
jgi:hypothetical protein